jgi:hydrogenase maturation protease
MKSSRSRRSEDNVNVLVLGIGNVLMMDDSVGVRVIEEIEKKYCFPEGVELLDGGTSGIELLSYIADRDHLIIVDALKSGFDPGTVVKVEGKDVPARFMTRISPHQLGLSDVLAAATISDQLPKSMVLFGVEPKTVELGLGLSDEVRASFDKLLRSVVEELERIGCGVVPLEIVSSKRTLWETQA